MQQRDERVTQLAEKHRAAMETPEGRHRLMEQLQKRRRGGGSLLLSAAWLGWRLLLLYAFCTVSLNCLENSFQDVSYRIRTGRALSYLNLVYLKSYRWLTVQLGLYGSEFMHSRDREACLLPNPLYRQPIMCCGCRQVRISNVSLAGPAGRDTFRRAVDRHVTPILVTDSGHQPITFRQLRQTVLDAWDDVSAGSNRIASHLGGGGGGPTTLEGLLRHEEPPAGRVVSWTFGHMSAIRAVRRLVSRPPFVRPDVDVSFARAFYLFGEGSATAAEPAPLGDLSQFHGIGILLGLHGGIRVTLSAKPECCGGSSGNASAVITPGVALVLPCNCYRVHAVRQGEGYAMVHLFSVFSSTGIKQPAPITGRVAEVDETD